MMKKQGKIKAIPVKEVTEGMQVIIYNPETEKKYWLSKVTKVEGKLIFVKYISDDPSVSEPEYNYHLNHVRILVTEYHIPWDKELGSKYDVEKGYLKQLPLKHSQWQEAIDNGLVDSDKTVEFEIICKGNKNSYPYSSYHEHQDRCPNCLSKLNIDKDLDENDYCNECRPSNVKEYAKIIPQEETWDDFHKFLGKLPSHTVDATELIDVMKQENYHPPKKK